MQRSVDNFLAATSLIGGTNIFDNTNSIREILLNLVTGSLTDYSNANACECVVKYRGREWDGYSLGITNIPRVAVFISKDKVKTVKDTTSTSTVVFTHISVDYSTPPALLLVSFPRREFSSAIGFASESLPPLFYSDDITHTKTPNI